MNISANALNNVDEKYPYGNVKFLRLTSISAMMILGLGIGIFLFDFGTDISFAVEMTEMSAQKSTEEIEMCRKKTEELNHNYTAMTCYQSLNRTENFKCMDLLNKVQHEARNCFNREQHFDSENLKQFTYMRITLILINLS